MLELLTPIIASFLGLLTAIVVWFQLRTKLETKKLENAKEIEDLRSTNQNLIIQKLDVEIGLLQGALSTLRNDLETFKKSVEKSVISLEVAEKKYTETQQKAENVLVALKTFIEKTDEKFSWMESKFREVDTIHMKHGSEIVKLGKDLIMIKGQKGGK